MNGWRDVAAVAVDGEQHKHCLGCGHKLDRKPDWVGLPAGVKFDPTDQEIMEHLEAKVNSQFMRSHPLIDEFIPTIEGDDGICYTHPEKLPGVTRDGLSRHFFHRPSKAYTTGTRKRRKIQTERDVEGGETRWHKTGKTRPVMANGRQKGCKKILVLYTNFGKHRKPEKTNWVMHQYHLGEHEEEREGELVVSKIFYQTQPRQCGWTPDRVGAATAAAAVGVDSGSGSSSSREVVGMRDDLSSVAAGISGYSIKANDNFSFSPFRKTFDEVGMGEKTRQQLGHAHEEEEDERHEESSVVAVQGYHHRVERNQHQHDHGQSLLVALPTNPISALLSPTTLHQAAASVVALDDPYNRFLHLPHDRLQQQQGQMQQKALGRPTSGLEELIMGCTSSELRGAIAWKITSIWDMTCIC